MAVHDRTRLIGRLFSMRCAQLSAPVRSKRTGHEGEQGMERLRATVSPGSLEANRA
jgi:hypothetical protein